MTNELTNCNAYDAHAKWKICNGAKLGALILLECQECQEAYHPLCHQPPIVDVDVYDPRFVWRCRPCVEKSSSLSSATSSKVKTTGRGSASKVRQTDGAAKEKEDAPGTRMLGRRRGVFLGRSGTHRANNRTSRTNGVHVAAFS